MYSQDELSTFLLPRLREIAKSIGIKRVEQYKKKELLNIILERQDPSASHNDSSSFEAEEANPSHNDIPTSDSSNSEGLSAEEKEDLIAKAFSRFKSSDDDDDTQSSSQSAPASQGNVSK